MAYILNYNSGNNIKEIIDAVSTKKSNMVTASFNVGGKPGTTRMIKIGNNMNSWCKAVKVNGKEEEISDTIQVRVAFPCEVQYILKDESVIDERAFAGCSIAASITLPTSITAIRDSAFDGCSSNVVIYNQVPPALIADAFNGFNGTIYVLEDYLPLYKQQWRGVAINIIQ